METNACATPPCLSPVRRARSPLARESDTVGVDPAAGLGVWRQSGSRTCMASLKTEARFVGAVGEESAAHTRLTNKKGTGR